MNNLIELKKAVKYSTKRISSDQVSLKSFITTDNILQNRGGISLATNLPPQGNSMPAYVSENILVANIRPYLKKIWFSDRVGGCSSDVLVFEVNKNFYPKYVYYSMFGDNFFEHMMRGSKGTKMPRGDKNHILDFLIPNFDFQTQQKIATVLSSLDSKIELNNHINIELEAMAKTIYDYWFVQFDFPNINGKPYKKSGGKMVWNEKLKREIPDKWEVKSLNEIVDKIIDHRGKTPMKLGGNWSENGEGVIALSAKHVKGGKLIKLEEANKVSFEMFNRWMPNKLQEGDILMTSEAPCGEFYLILNDINYCLSQRLFAIRANQSKVYSAYLYFELSRGNGFSQIIGKQSGSTVFGIRQDELRTVNVLCPPAELQQVFHQKIKPLLFKIRNNESQNQQLSSLRDWLLPLLMNGQIRVTNNEYEQLAMAAEPKTAYKNK